MGYCEHPGCLSVIDTPEEQKRHNEVFDKNCTVCGCFNGTNRMHMLNKRHHECGFGGCREQGIKFRSDADARRHWNECHRGGEEVITHDRFGNSLGDKDEDGYHSDPAYV